MKNLLLLTVIAALPTAALAVPPPQPTPPPPPQPTMPAPPAAVDVSEDDLDTFATIYVGMEDVRSDLQERAAATESREELAQLQQEANQQFVAIIKDNGWTLDRYNEVTQTINQDERLRRRAVELIGEKS